MKLNSEQEERISQRVDQHPFRLPSLRDDVLDHLCCVVESQLGKGKDFEQLLEEAITDLAPRGLEEIERETVFLLNSKRILLMKKLMYFIGFLGSVSLALGTTFKLMHWPGANVLLGVGFLVLFLIFLPLLAVDRYKVAISKNLSERLKFILGVLAGITVGMSVFFKILHLQGADILFVAGAMLFAIGFLPFLFFTMYRRSIS